MIELCVSTYLYRAFDCMFLSCHVHVSEWIHTKWLSVRLRSKWLLVRVQLRHLNLRFRACFEQGVPWHSGNCRVWIHSETRTWHDKNIQSSLGSLPRINISLFLLSTFREELLRNPLLLHFNQIQHHFTLKNLNMHQTQNHIQNKNTCQDQYF